MTTELTLSTGSGSDGVPVLTVSGEIDMSNAGVFATALAEAVGGHGPLIVDLSAVEYLDSAGLAALFGQAEHIQVRTGPLLAPLLEISGIGAVTTVHHV
jgi:anti-sigma B factor antagonist